MLLGVVPFGLIYGVLATSAGMPAWLAVAMSAIVFGGASQMILVQLWAELRLAVRMYFDPRYRISRTAQLAFPLAAVLMVLNYFFFAQWLSLPVFSPLVERVLYVLLGVFLYRVLQRELDRYKAVLDYLARFTHQ